MPRYVDHADRRREIIRATTEVIAESGLRGLSFRAVAKRLGGSTTVVTHYFPTQAELLDAMAAFFAEPWDEQLRALDQNDADPRARLREVLIWLVPTHAHGLAEERARINLLADELGGNEHRQVFRTLDRRMRRLIREHVAQVVEPARVDELVEFFRVLTSGIVLSVVEHPKTWPARRQIALIDQALAISGLAPDGKGS